MNPLIKQLAQSASKIDSQWSYLAFSLVIVLTILVASNVARKGKASNSKTTPNEIILEIIKVIVFGVIAMIIALTPVISQTIIARDQIASDETYHVQVTVVSAKGLPVTDVTVICSKGETPKFGNQRWEITIPKSAVKNEPEIEVTATSNDHSQTGSVKLTLGAALQPAVKIEMHSLDAKVIVGKLLDSHNKGVPNAQIWDVDAPKTVATSEHDGRFSLATNAAVGSRIFLICKPVGGKETRNMIVLTGDNDVKEIVV